MPKPKLIVLAGPTAVGKTAIGIELAKKLNTVIVSADARQVYKELSIGTARPTEAEMEGVPHFFISSHSIFDAYSVGDFEQEALKLLEELFQKYESVILVGGSGLYVRAVCDGLDEMPPSDSGIRENLTTRLASEGLPVLADELRELDPDFAGSVDVHNPQRVLRALEVCLSTGKPFSHFRTGNKNARPFDIIKIGLERDRAELYDRINHRVDIMLQHGLLEEVKSLFPNRHLNALNTVGYTELFNFLEGKIDIEEAVRLVKRNSRRYAKRQLTWFRKDKDFTWFNAIEKEEIINFALSACNIPNL